MFHHQIRIPFSMGQVLEPPADEVVDDMDAKTFVQQPIDHMAADKSGSSCDDCEFGQADFRAQSYFKLRALTVFTLMNASSFNVSPKIFAS